MNAAEERVGQGVRRRQRGKVGEHDFAHAYGVDDRLEEDSLVFNLRANHDEKAGNDEPVGVQGHAADHDGEGNQLADSRSGAACGREAVSMSEVAAQQAAEVEWIGGKQMQNSEPRLHPDHASHQVVSGDEGTREQFNISAGADKGGGQHQRRQAVHHWSDECHGELAEALVGSFLTFGIGVGEEPADGEQKDGAQLEVEIGGHHQAGNLAHSHGRCADEEEGEAAQNSGRGAKAKTNERKSGKKDVNAHLHAHPSAQRYRPATHIQIVVANTPSTRTRRSTPGSEDRFLGDPVDQDHGGSGARSVLICWFAMRVIAGTLRRRMLEAPAGMSTRPTSDRLRETLFNVLAPRMEGAWFLDLYAGSGAVGIEAASRGATTVVLVERAEPALRVLRANLERLGLRGSVRLDAVSVGAFLRRVGLKSGAVGFGGVVF